MAFPLGEGPPAATSPALAAWLRDGGLRERPLAAGNTIIARGPILSRFPAETPANTQLRSNSSARNAGTPRAGLDAGHGAKARAPVSTHGSVDARPPLPPSPGTREAPGVLTHDETIQTTPSLACSAFRNSQTLHRPEGPARPVGGVNFGTNPTEQEELTISECQCCKVPSKAIKAGARAASLLSDAQNYP